MDGGEMKRKRNLFQSRNAAPRESDNESTKKLCNFMAQQKESFAINTE